MAVTTSLMVYPQGWIGHPPTHLPTNAAAHDLPVLAQALQENSD
jgi:hypothetical protein